MLEVFTPQFIQYRFKRVFVLLSFRDDHNAQICSSCIVSVEAFFKYKIKCVENDKLLRKRRTNFFSGLGLTADPVSVRASGILDDEEKQLTKSDSNSKSDDGTNNLQVKQEVVDEDDEGGFFNPDQFLSQETQIGDKQIDQASLNGNDQPNFGSGNSSFERGWRTTEFSPQPGSSGLKPLKITDYSNLTGKRGRPQKFITTVPTERLLARPGMHPNPFHTSSPLPPQARGFESAYRQHLNMSNGGKLSIHPPMPIGSRYDPFLVNTVEQTRKVQKFLDDGLRDLILNAGAPNPNFVVDGGYTSFKVVKARCNSYNLIFEANRFLRRNKSCSGLPKWYWACSINGCPVKVCSYKGRLFKTNDKINHIHPPTETDDKQHEAILPEHADEAALQQEHQSPTVSPHPQSRQQPARLMSKSPLTAKIDSVTESLKEEEFLEDTDAYKILKGEDGDEESLLYKNHKHKLIKIEKNAVKVWECISKTENDEKCKDIIYQLHNGKIKLESKIKKEGLSEEEDEAANDDEADGGKRKSRAPKVALYEGYQYKYCHARPEGSLYWRCMMRQESNCQASLHTKATFEFINFNDQAHNHDPPDPTVQIENVIICNVIAPQKVPSTPPTGSTDFQLVKSGQKREFLIYQGYRYYFQYESKNGKRSYRCTMFRNCPAGAFLMPDNTIAEAKNFVHTHPPTENLEKYVTKDSLITSPIKDADGQPRRQQQTVAESGQFPMLSDPVVSASSNEDVARANGYKIILNYKNKEILIYNGWRYFVDYKKKNGGQVWRCSSHRLCRGAVHLFPDGSINFAKLVDHNHMPPKRSLSTPNSAMDSSRMGDSSNNSSFGSGLLLDTSANAYAPPYHRYIVHNGHRFRFATRKREGTIYWRCAMRLDTKCPVSFHTKEDTYELVSMRNHEHNHEIPAVWPEVAGGQIEEELPTVKLPQEEIGTSDYILAKNSKGRDVILYQNGRYYLDYSRKDGKIVFRCSSVAGCRATVFLLPNKTLQVPRDLVHTHGATSMMNNLLNRPNANMLDQSGGSKSDDEVQLIATPDPLSIDLDQSMEPTSSSSASSSLLLPKFIVHHGYHYKYVSKNMNDQTAFWRCSNYEAKMNCQTSLYTTLSGQVIRTNNILHNHKAEDYNNASANNSLAKRKNLIGSRDYKIVKNWKNRDVLVFQQCRYFLHYVRKDGRKVWRCSAIRSCHAAVYLGADGRVDQVKGEHVHDVRLEGEPRRRRPRKPHLELTPSVGTPGGNGSVHPGNGNEWIDYSDYGMQLNSSNDNNSLWDNFNPHQMAAGLAGDNGGNFDFSYHSVFGNQPNFGDSFGMLADDADTTGLDDDDEGLPLEPDVSFHENDSYENLQNEQDLVPLVQMDGVEERSLVCTSYRPAILPEQKIVYFDEASSSTKIAEEI
ncbi:uncharacterized protein LOC131440453 isoform X2 [Malaya genurostris]|uniref:uncharacterized protein LOC131440453 isoform X2 n=1 Tax=Malaya genurostris TaxID=325434 RepID=UPI0026F3E1D3|nr:uncharacterized protein LOC131440453 isoform X2 [Malaya genurostris]